MSHFNPTGPYQKQDLCGIENRLDEIIVLLKQNACPAYDNGDLDRAVEAALEKARLLFNSVPMVLGMMSKTADGMVFVSAFRLLELKDAIAAVEKAKGERK